MLQVVSQQMLLSKYHEILSMCRRSKAAYLHKNTIWTTYKNSICYHENKQSSQKLKSSLSHAFLHHENHKVYVTFRGTLDVFDTKNAIDIRHQHIESHDIKVHKGFYNTFAAMEEEMTRDLKDIVKSYKIDEIVFGGHSKGASIAMIASPYYSKILKTLCNHDLFVKTITFGSVAVGNIKFVNWFIDNIDEHFRVENEEDIVPHIPVHPQFHHIPNRLLLNKHGDVSMAYGTCSSTYTKFVGEITKRPSWDEIYIEHSCEKYENNLTTSFHKYPKFWLDL